MPVRYITVTDDTCNLIFTGDDFPTVSQPKERMRVNKSDTHVYVDFIDNAGNSIQQITWNATQAAEYGYTIDTLYTYINDFVSAGCGSSTTTADYKHMISGGVLWSGNGLDYDVSLLTYYFNGQKTAGPDQITLDASDATNDRFDAVVVDEAGVISTLTGTAAPEPGTPSIPDDQLLVVYILVGAATTAPTPDVDDIYLENAEWATSNYTTAGGVVGSTDFNYGTSPKQGIKCIHNNRDGRTGDRFVRASQINIQDYTMLTLWVRFTSAIAANKSLNLRWENSSGTLIGSNINLFTQGLSRSVLNTWQLVILPVSLFGNITNVKGLKVILAGGTNGTPVAWDIDKIQLTDGASPQYSAPQTLYTSFTHAALLALKNAAGLVTGEKYGITDFKNIYDQPDFESDGTEKAVVVTKTATDFETLILTATSPSTFDSIVQSVQFPDDKLIKYDITWILTEVMGAAAKGRIVERIDNRNKKADYDHRTVKYKRYQEWITLGAVTITGTTVTSGVKEFFQQLETGEVIKINGVSFTVASVDDTGVGDMEQITVTSNGTALSGSHNVEISRYTSWKDNGNASAEFFTWNETALSFDSILGDYALVAPIKGYAFLLPNIVFMGISTANRIGDDCRNHTYYGFQTNWHQGDSIRDVRVIGDSAYNFIGWDSFGILITGRTEQNSIWGAMQSCVLGCHFDNNIQYDLLENSTFGTDNRHGVYYGTNDGLTVGNNNLKCKYWDAEDLTVGSNNQSVDFGSAKHINAPSVLTGIKNVEFTPGINGAAWVNGITVALHPEMYATYRKQVITASDGNIYTKYSNGVIDVLTIIN